MSAEMIQTISCDLAKKLISHSHSAVYVNYLSGASLVPLRSFPSESVSAEMIQAAVRGYAEN